MFGSGLHFNTPDIVRVQKTFSVAADPTFLWTRIDPIFRDQNIIIELPLTGPSLIPFLCFTTGVDIDPDVASLLTISYYGDGAIANAALFSIPVLGGITDCFCTYSNEVSNFNNAATVWPVAGSRATSAGIIISSDAPWVSGTSLTITLYCVRSGLNY